MHIHTQNSHGTNNFRIAEQITTNHMILSQNSVTFKLKLFFMDPLFPLTNLRFSITYMLTFKRQTSKNVHP